MAQNTCFFFRTFFIVLSISGLIGQVVASDCYRTTTYEYNGQQHTTKDEQTCIRWDSFDHKYSDPETFPEATTSEDENYCRDPGRDGYLWCYVPSYVRNYNKCDIEKCDTADVNQCGSLKIEQPTILGRNVTFTFTPETTSDADLEWQRAKQGNSWSTLPNDKKFRQYFQDGTYYLILADTVRDKDEKFYRVDYKNNSVSCLMETPKLELQDISSNDCGFVYLRTTKVKEGENVELEYYPSEYVMQNEEHTVRQWMHSKDSINVTKNVYEEEREPNDKYVLTIIMFNEQKNGRYGVYCGKTASLSNFVEVILPVAPSTPAFEGLKDIDDCKECIVGEDGDQCGVLCKTSGGTQPINVTMSIGNESLSLGRYNETAGYITIFTLSNRHHMTIMTCTVMNDALTSPLITTARVYVIKSPTLQLFVPQILKEGNNGNIACILDSGRPAPNVTINISGMEVSSAVQTDSFNATTSLYTSVVSLPTFERIWNRENVQCCRFNEWYKRINVCSTPQRINVMFPPTDIKLEVKVEQKRPLEIYAICTVYNSNPACRADISAPNGVIVSERYTNNMSRAHGAWDSEYAVNLNVDKNDDGEKIKCAADCQKFAVDLKDVHSIGLPQKDEKRYKDSDDAASCDNSSIWIILGSCSAVLFVVVVIVCLIAIKKIRDTKAELEAYKVRFSANPDRISRNDVELEDRAYENSSRNDVELEDRAYENSSRNDVELEDRAYENSSRNDVELEDRAYERLNDTRQATGQSETFYSQLSP
ncbi:uncharacterized protein LOC123559725 isoform X1 [Mercenaria mercenaria]|uniref:uncharacterized protein LOC123559725 isoform X1 n=1 Tax=Mercenaria mercenaria TaxID=6596 RepID=UPI00234F0B37|nr:uncharacterized protein LOC123559725 isoform X1 [Mercenaria mercenaria]